MSNAALSLINSEHFRNGNVEDRLDDEQWLAVFLAKLQLPGSASPRQVRQLRKLRRLLREIAEQLTAKQAVSDRALDELNGFLAPVMTQETVTRSATGGYARKRMSVGKVAPAFAVARDFLQLLVDGDWRRLKVCANATCRWAFYDESRARVRIWCDSARCGNVMKVRRFRERNRRR